MRNAWIIVAAMLIALDRALKIAAQYGLIEGWSFFDFYPRLTLHQNYGLAFGLPFGRIAIIAVTTLVLAALIVWLIQIWRTRPSIRKALIFIIIGAASNLFDRIFYGFVIDTIEFFPRSIWNVADIMILVGLFILMRPYGKSEVRGIIRA